MQVKRVFYSGYLLMNVFTRKEKHPFLCRASLNFTSTELMKDIEHTNQCPSINREKAFYVFHLPVKQHLKRLIYEIKSHL